MPAGRFKTVMGVLPAARGLPDSRTTCGGTGSSSRAELFGGKIGYKTNASGKINLSVFAGVDNAFNAKYSLGNDINAAAGRYYNAAAGVNYFAGLTISFNKSKHTYLLSLICSGPLHWHKSGPRDGRG